MIKYKNISVFYNESEFIKNWGDHDNDQAESFRKNKFISIIKNKELLVRTWCSESKKMCETSPFDSCKNCLFAQNIRKHKLERLIDE